MIFKALQYAKVQVVKRDNAKPSKRKPKNTDPTEQYVNSLFPESYDDADYEGSG